MAWPAGPRWIGVSLYLAFGWAAIWFAETLLPGPA